MKFFKRKGSDDDVVDPFNGSSDDSSTSAPFNKRLLSRQMTVAEAKRNKRLMLGGSLLIIVGIFFFLLGILIQFVLFPIIMEAIIYAAIELEPSNPDTWEAFVEPPVPIFFNYNFFSVTNGESFTSGNETRPSVIEVGPYSFSEYRIKKEILEVGVDMIQYGQYYEFYYNQTETDRLGCKSPTGGRCDGYEDEITILNPVLSALVPILMPNPSTDTDEEAAAKADFLEKFNTALTDPTQCDGCQDELFITVRIMDFLYDGVEYPSLKALGWALKETQGPGTQAIIEAIQAVANAIGERFDLDILPIKIGFLAADNATVGDEWYTINSGMVDPARLLDIVKFKGETQLPDEWWPDAPSTPGQYDAGLKGVCKDLYGTDGTQFPPYPSKHRKLWIFVSQLCRPMWLDFVRESKFRDVDCYQFRPTDAVFDMRNPDNYCYCPDFHECAVRADNGLDEWDTSGCEDLCVDGMVRVQGCYGGAPIVMSAPHFLHGDQSLVDGVDGLAPSYELHDTYLDIEIMSGVPFAAHKRIQFNVQLYCDNPYVDLMSQCQDVLMPIFWADEAADMDDENYDLWIHDVERPVKIVLGVCIAAGMVLGLIIFAGGVWMCWRA